MIRIEAEAAEAVRRDVGALPAALPAGFSGSRTRQPGAALGERLFHGDIPQKDRRGHGKRRRSSGRRHLVLRLRF
ncbi:MAG TPA: hypothetical protein VE224_19480, partial [Pseudolabrys sp.]|nr:hypothetical protein [Pseudolabrys sp.]